MDAETIRKWFEKEMNKGKEMPDIYVSPTMYDEIVELKKLIELPEFTVAQNPNESESAGER